MIVMDPLRSWRGPRSLSNRLESEPRFRIQVQETESGCWRMYANFQFSGEAEACLDALNARGIEARLIDQHATSADYLAVA